MAILTGSGAGAIVRSARARRNTCASVRLAQMAVEECDDATPGVLFRGGVVLNNLQMKDAKGMDDLLASGTITGTYKGVVRPPSGKHACP
jgi:hypothetical protein